MTVAFVPEIMEDAKQHALTRTLERLLNSEKIVKVWPAASSSGNIGQPVRLGEVEIVVLSLERIGAPAGASGASVYIAYYSHAPKKGPALLASPPLVVKIGDIRKLQEEKQAADSWPSMSLEDAQLFARPIHLDSEDDQWAVLVAPFHSEFNVREEGTRNDVKVHDLWRLLNSEKELLAFNDDQSKEVRMCVEQALEAVKVPHRGPCTKPKRIDQTYADAYSWYLRGTTGDGHLSHIPKLLFGSNETVRAFGQTWGNPVPLVEELVSKRLFTGHFGATHGDLHPKNIVLNHENAARIIDFGWARHEAHVVQDYLLLDLNLRGITLPSQIAEADILALAGFLFPDQEVATLPERVRWRATIIKEVVWKKAKARAVKDWATEYLIPFLLVGYGLLVHLDNARNQPALVAAILSAARAVKEYEKATAP